MIMADKAARTWRVSKPACMPRFTRETAARTGFEEEASHTLPNSASALPNSSASKWRRLNTRGAPRAVPHPSHRKLLAVPVRTVESAVRAFPGTNTRPAAEKSQSGGLAP